MSERLPNSRDCFVCGVGNSRGLKMTFHRDEGRVYAHVTLPTWAVGFSGVAHGGLVATLLDEVMGWCANCALKSPTVTAEMTVRYRQPTPVNEELLLEADVIKSRGALAYVSGRLLRSDGTLCASSTGKHMRTPSADAVDGTRYELVYAPGDARIFED